MSSVIVGLFCLVWLKPHGIFLISIRSRITKVHHLTFRSISIVGAAPYSLITPN